MISLTISDRIKPVVHVPAVYTPVQPAVSTKVYQETMRRDAIMKDLAKEFKHGVGDTIVPKNPKDAAKWGKCTVMGICTEYIHLEKDYVWPPNDNPMIITASSENGEIFYATTNYFAE